jgi:hypothetical protein
MNTIKINRQGGSIIAAVLAGIIVVVVVATGIMVAMHNKKGKPVVQGSSDTAQQSADDKAAAKPSGTINTVTPRETLGRAERNVLRSDDATNLLTATAEYQNNNNGSLPTDYSDGQLGGGEGSTPSIVTLKAYTDITLTNGAHAAVTKGNELVLVTGAMCGTNGAAVAGTSRSAVALYGFENGDADFTGKCLTT